MFPVNHESYFMEETQARMENTIEGEPEDWRSAIATC
jgi:hypothetical protein